MKRLKKWAALVLTAAMVVTSIQTPVFAATDEAVSVMEVTEDSAAEETITEETADVVEETAGAIQADTSAATETAGEEDPVGADGTIYVRSAADVVSALNGVDPFGREIPTKDKVQIKLMQPLDGYNYQLTRELLGGKDLTVKAGMDIAVDLDSYAIGVSDNAVDYDIVVPADTTLSVESNDRHYYGIDCGIVNNGTLNIVSAYVSDRKGDSVVNNAGATADIEDGNIDSVSKDSVAIKNAGTMTLGNGTSVTADRDSYVAIENKASLLINGADIDSGASTVSSCGIKNLGAAAELSFRGTSWNDSLGSAYGIFNDAGTVTIGGFDSTSQYSYIEGDRCAILTVNGGTVVGYDRMQIEGDIATTPFAGNDAFQGTTDGTFKMLGGTADRIIYGTNLPILIGGIVGNTTSTSASALQIKTSASENQTDVSKYTYLNEENGTPVAGTYTAAGGEKKIAYAIVDGKVYTTDSGSDNTIYVSNEEELRQAAVSGGMIELTSDISLSQNLVLGKDACINMYYLGNHTLSQTVSAGAITVNAGVNVQLQNGAINFQKMTDGASAITNNGNLEITDVDITIAPANNTVKGASAITNTGSGSLNISQFSNKTIKVQNIKNGIGINNAGTADVEIYRIYSTGADGCVGLKNSGTCTYRGSYLDATRTSSVSQCTAVYNAGKFVMTGGYVRTYSGTDNAKCNFAIVYTGTNYPVLSKGYVRGANYQNVTVSQDNPVLGSAVVKEESTGVYSRGSFQISDSETASLVDGQNSFHIVNGVPQYVMQDSALRAYLLLEKGDVIPNIQNAFYFAADGSKGDYTWTITSSDESVVSKPTLSSDKINWMVSANKAGYAILEAQLTLNDNTSQTIKDYLRIEVTDKKADLKAEDYTGSLLADAVEVNGYTDNRYAYSVPFEFHLNTSEMATGKDYSDAAVDSFEVSEIIIDDQEFNKYFTYQGFGTSLTDKNTYLSFVNQTNGANSTRLLEDEIKSIDQVEVKAKISNSASNEDMLISLGYLTIHVNNAKPVVKATDSIRLNSAFNRYESHYEAGVEKHPNWATASSAIAATVQGQKAVLNTLTNKSLSDGLEWIDESAGEFSANVKKGKESVTAMATVLNYVGSYQVTIPVTVVNQYPTVTLDKKSVTVSKKSSAETDIPMIVYAKNAEAAGTVQGVEIVTGKNKSSNYTVKNQSFAGSYYSIPAKQWIAGSFYLQPKSILNKQETVTLKVTYHNTNAKAGKPYSTLVKVTVKPVDKFTIKQYKKASLCTYTSADRTNMENVYIKTTPEYFKGAKLVVTGLNGKAVPEEVAGKQVVTNNLYSGIYFVQAAATENTKNLGKKLEFGVAWVDENGKVLTGTKTAKMTVSLFADTSAVATTEASITVQPEKIYKKLVWNENGIVNWTETDKLKVEYTAPVKFTGKGSWDMDDYSDNMFDITYSQKTKKIILKANKNVIAGTSYKIPLTFTNDYTDETKTVQLNVKVADIKKVTAKFSKDAITLYQDAPYVAGLLNTAIDEFYVTNPLAGAGLTEITKVEIVGADASPFEVFDCREYTNGSDQQRYYGVTFKNKKCPSSVTGKQFKTVTLRITYGNGIKSDYKTADVKLKVNIRPTAKKAK